jgi:hypothetical protein
MEEFNEIPETAEVLISGIEAIKFAGSLNRPATEMEIDELALFFATDFIKGDVELLGEEFDHIQYILAINREKEEMIEELQMTTYVTDMVNLQTQIFHIYDFMVNKTSVTNKLSFSHGFSRVIKQNGILKLLTDEDCFDL